jgi:hypothetical protein
MFPTGFLTYTTPRIADVSVRLPIIITKHVSRSDVLTVEPSQKRRLHPRHNAWLKELMQKTRPLSAKIHVRIDLAQDVLG